MKHSLYLFLMLFGMYTFAQTSTTYHKTTTTKRTVTTTKKKPVTTSKSSAARVPAGVMVWTVDAQRAKCEGPTTMQCLLVREQGKKAFELFYENIDGFDYQEGYVYTIWVKRTAKTPPVPVNASIYRYSLVKVVSKKATPGFSNTHVENSKPYSGMTESMTKTIVVNEEKAPCSGGENKRCLLIKDENKKTFELYYQDIQGFNFERGFRQTIVVNATYIPNGLASSQPTYTFVRLISKVPVQLESHDTSTTPAGWAQGRTALDKKWYLKKMKDTDTSSYTIDDKAVWIEFITAENRYTGRGPCNSFFGGFKTDLISTFQASAITNTKVYCANIRLEDMLFSLLQNADNFMLKDGHLIFSKGDRLLLVFE